MASDLPSPDEDPSSERLLSILGVAFGLAGAVGGAIGAGILRTPGLVAAQLGEPRWILGAWLIGGLYALLGAICVAELGASLPRAGGWYVYSRSAFGDAAGFSVGWIDWLGHCAGVAWVATTIGEYGSALLPNLECPIQVTATLAILLFALVQQLGVASGSSSQKLLSLAKAVAFLALVAACFLIKPEVDGLPETPPLENALRSPLSGSAFGPGIAAVILALQGVITTYDGWHSPIYFAEEFERPSQDLPRSLIGGVLAVLGIYLLVNLALLHVLPMHQLAASILPAADAAWRLFGDTGGKLVTALALLSVLGLINASIMAAPRILYGLARDGLLVRGLARVNEGGTPEPALWLTVAFTTALVVAGDFPTLLAIAAFCYTCLYGSGMLALFRLRSREPDLPRPFLAWGYPWSALVVAAGTLAFLVGALLTDPLHSLLALVMIAVSVPLFQVVRLGGLLNAHQMVGNRPRPEGEP